MNSRVAPGGFDGWVRRERNRELKDLITLLTVIIATFTWYLTGR